MIPTPQVVEQMEVLGLEPYLYLLAGIEFVALVLYVIPKTFHLGFFLLTAYYGGAIAVKLTRPSETVPAIVFLTIIWVLSFIRRPELLIPKK